MEADWEPEDRGIRLTVCINTSEELIDLRPDLDLLEEGTFW